MQSWVLGGQGCLFHLCIFCACTDLSTYWVPSEQQINEICLFSHGGVSNRIFHFFICCLLTSLSNLGQPPKLKLVFKLSRYKVPENNTRFIFKPCNEAYDGTLPNFPFVQ